VEACQSGHTRIWACLDEAGPVLLFGLANHPFHSRIFNAPVGRVNPFYLLRLQTEPAQLAVRRLCSKAKSMGLDLLSLRILTSESFLNWSLSTSGWSHVGTSVKLGIDRDQWLRGCVDTGISTTYSSYQSSVDGVILREAEESDIALLANLIDRAHRHSYFFNDLGLPADGRKDLFPTWIERSVKGGMDLVLVALEEEIVLGFVSGVISRGLERFVGHEVGIVDFVAVDPGAQGRGIGTHLLRAAFAWFFERVPFVELRTMLDNVGALRFYIRSGLLPVTSDHHYHRWLRRAGYTA